MFTMKMDGSTTLNNGLYINKKTFEVVEYPVGHQRTKCVKIPEEAEECYYFDRNHPEGIEDLLFYTKDLEDTWCDDGYWSDNVESIEPSYSEIRNYVNTYGKLVWKRNIDKLPDDVNTVADAIHHPKHYTSDDCGVEAIEVTSLLPACISNAVKYVWRCGKKDEDLQELKKALWYINYSINNDLPSSIDGLSDSLEYEALINKVKSHWVGNKYMFIDAVYWGNQETMKKALELMIQEITSSQES